MTISKPNTIRGSTSASAAALRYVRPLREHSGFKQRYPPCVILITPLMSPLFSLILLMLSSETFDNLDTCRSLAGRNALLLSRTSWLVSRGLSFLFTTPSLQFTSPVKTVYLHRRSPNSALTPLVDASIFSMLMLSNWKNCVLNVNRETQRRMNE